jgi:hypothetical protein
MDEREYFNATNPCLARPDRFRRVREPRDELAVRRSVVRRLLAKLTRR